MGLAPTSRCRCNCNFFEALVAIVDAFVEIDGFHRVVRMAGSKRPTKQSRRLSPAVAALRVRRKFNCGRIQSFVPLIEQRADITAKKGSPGRPDRLRPKR